MVGYVSLCNWCWMLDINGRPSPPMPLIHMPPAPVASAIRCCTSKVERPRAPMLGPRVPFHCESWLCSCTRTFGLPHSRTGACSCTCTHVLAWCQVSVSCTCVSAPLSPVSRVQAPIHATPTSCAEAPCLGCVVPLCSNLTGTMLGSRARCCAHPSHPYTVPPMPKTTHLYCRTSHMHHAHAPNP